MKTANLRPITDDEWSLVVAAMGKARHFADTQGVGNFIVLPDLPVTPIGQDEIPTCAKIDNGTITRVEGYYQEYPDGAKHSIYNIKYKQHDFNYIPALRMNVEFVKKCVELPTITINDVDGNVRISTYFKNWEAHAQSETVGQAFVELGIYLQRNGK